MNKIISLQIDDNLIKQLNKIAKENCRNQSSQIRYIIQEFIEEYYSEKR